MSVPDAVRSVQEERVLIDLWIDSASARRLYRGGYSRSLGGMGRKFSLSVQAACWVRVVRLESQAGHRTTEGMPGRKSVLRVPADFPLRFRGRSSASRVASGRMWCQF
jgi:hypothetical protein